MLSFFRRIIGSRVGVVIALLFIGLIGVAFALGDATGLSKGSFGGQSASTALTVGDQTISTNELAAAANSELNRLKGMGVPQYAQMTMPEFIAQGGLDFVIDQQIMIASMTQFARNQGIRVGRPLLDSEIASQIADIRGLDGKVDPARYKQMLTALGLTDEQLHDRFAGMLITRMLMGPIKDPALAGMKGPVGMALPYASIMLEKRAGTVAFIDTNKMPAGAPVADAEAQAYYKKNIARYTIPERRSARYVALTMDELRKRATPTDDEIAKAYAAQSARFAAREERSLTQVVVADQQAANALAAKVRGGAAMDATAKAAGLEAAPLEKVDKGKYATANTQALADQVFAAPAGGVVGPVKTPLGWIVVKVDKVEAVAAKTLDQAKPDLIKELTDAKLQAVAQELNDQIQDAVTNRQSFDQIAQMLKLPIASVPPLAADGTDPTAAKPTPPDPNLKAIYQVAFGSEIEDDPQIVQFGKDGSALTKLDKVIPAQPKPYAEVADQVKKDITVERQLKAARDVANGILNKVNKGMSLDQAMKETGIALDGTKKFDGVRMQVNDPSKPPPSQLVLLFKTAPHNARLLEAPNKGGWFVIVVDTVTPGDASKDQDGINRQRDNLAQKAPDEYEGQFIRSVRDAIGVKRNAAAIAAVRAQLAGKGAEDQPQ